MRVAWATLTGLAAGLAVAAFTNAALYPPWDVSWPPNIAGFWGLFYGCFAAVAGFGIALWLFSRRHTFLAKAGLLLAAATLGLFGLAVLWWILMWGIPPFTLEGAWTYPLAVVPLIGVGVLVKAFERVGKTVPEGATIPKDRWSPDLYR